MGRRLSIVYLGGGYIDSLAEASLVTLARRVRAGGQANFVVVSNAGAWYGKSAPVAVGRAGREANGQVLYWLQPGDKGYAEQAYRALNVADVEGDLGALYPVSPATAH